jgi:hypothetical protein
VSGRRRIPREIIIKHAGEYSEAEARAKIIKMIAEHKRGCALPDGCGRKKQHRGLCEDKQG